MSVGTGAGWTSETEEVEAGGTLDETDGSRYIKMTGLDISKGIAIDGLKGISDSQHLGIDDHGRLYGQRVGLGDIRHRRRRNRLDGRDNLGDGRRRSDHRD